jgi:hypothetical protein
MPGAVVTAGMPVTSSPLFARSRAGFATTLLHTLRDATVND